MGRIVSFLIAVVLAATVVLPGFAAQAEACHSHGSSSKVVEAAVLHGADDCFHHDGPFSSQHRHCDGPFHPAGCGHVTSYFSEAPSFLSVEIFTGAYVDFEPLALPSPFLERPLQPPRA